MKLTSTLAVVFVLATRAFATGGEGDDPAARALAWLRSYANEREAPAAEQAMGNAADKRIATLEITAFLAAIIGDAATDAALADRLDAAVTRAVDGDLPTFGAFANWTDGFAALYLFERSLRDGKDRPAFARLARRIAEYQNDEGGWGHGASLGPSFYPSTLIATTNWSLLGLGLARRRGIAVDGECIDAGLDLVRHVQAANGSLPYGGLPYRRGFEAGRTSGTVLALAALGLGDTDAFRRAADYVLRNVASLPNGHASPAMHVLMGALACYVLGDEAWASYDRDVLARVRAAQKPDGSFNDVVDGSPDSFAIMAEAATNTAYVTAFYAAALAVTRSRLANELRRATPPVKSTSAADEPAAPAVALASATVAGARRVALADDAVVVLDAKRRLSILDRRTGVVRAKSTAALDDAVDPAAYELTVDGPDVFAWAPWWKSSGASDAMDIEQLLHPTQAEQRRPGAVVCYSIADATLRWSKEIAGNISSVRLRGDDVLVHCGRSGRVTVLDRKDGAARKPLAGPIGIVNGAIAPLDGGRLAIAGEAELAIVDAGGDEVWKDRCRALGGITPASWSRLLAAGDRLYAGRSDGTVVCRRAADGATQWKLDLGADVIALGLSESEPLAVLTGDGRAHGVSDGKLVWTRDVSRGLESTRPPEMRVTSAGIWLRAPAAKLLIRLDPKTGAVAARIPLAENAEWDARGDAVAIASDDRVQLFDGRAAPAPK